LLLLPSESSLLLSVSWKRGGIMAGEGEDLFPVHPLHSVVVLSSPAADEGRESLLPLIQLPFLRVRSIRSMTRDIDGSLLLLLLLLLWLVLSEFTRFRVSIYGSPALLTMYLL
jgi:hypothetical protein